MIRCEHCGRHLAGLRFDHPLQCRLQSAMAGKVSLALPAGKVAPVRPVRKIRIHEAPGNPLVDAIAETGVRRILHAVS